MVIGPAARAGVVCRRKPKEGMANVHVLLTATTLWRRRATALATVLLLGLAIPSFGHASTTLYASTEEALAASEQDSQGSVAVRTGWDGGSARPSISSTGRYVALASAASNMVADDTNGSDDIFVYDFGSLRTTRISLTAAGAQANGPSSEPSMSGDGRYVAFRSSASNLVNGDTNGAADIFISDRITGAVTRVSVDGTGAQTNGPSFSPSISGDGRYVAFRSSASNLVNGDTNAADDIFVRDRTAGTTTRVSVDSSGAQANASSSSPAISGNGGFVAFQSAASNLVAGDTNSTADVFVRSLAGASTTRVSLTTSGNQASAASSSPSVSFDGSRIAFASTASLASGDANSGSDIYVRDRIANTTTWAMAWVKTGWWGTTGAGTSPSISGDGRYVAFALDADVHIADVNRARDIYEYDLATGAWAHISRDDLRGGGDKASDFPSLSSDGTYAAFESSATNFHIDTNGAPDAFVHKWSGLPTTASDSSAAESSTATGDDATAQQTPLPRACSLGKDAIATGEPSAELSTSDSTGTQIDVTTGFERLSCRVTPVPPPIPPVLPKPPYPVPPLQCIFWPELCFPDEDGGSGVETVVICDERTDEWVILVKGAPGTASSVIETGIPCAGVGGDLILKIDRVCEGGELKLEVTVKTPDGREYVYLFDTDIPC